MSALTRRAALAAALTLALPAAALADGEEEKRITKLSPNITPLEKNITPLETVDDSGDTTEITLQADILFPFGSSELSDAAVARIEDLVQDVPEGAAVSVDGHTDDIPFSGTGGNKKLSEDRAQAVADAISASRSDLDLTVAGHADSDPVEQPSGEDASAARAKNRRVEIRYGH